MPPIKSFQNSTQSFNKCFYGAVCICNRINYGKKFNWYHSGEPLLAMDIIESMSVRIMEICKKAKRKYISDITTNGYLLSLDVFRKLLDLNVIEYQITIDGPKEIHDAKKATC